MLKCIWAPRDQLVICNKNTHLHSITPVGDVIFRCKRKVPAHKQFLIHRAPNILTLQLKRYGRKIILPLLWSFLIVMAKNFTCFCGSMDLTLVLHVCQFFVMQVWLQSEFWRKNIKTCWVRRISEPKTFYDIPGKKTNLIQGSKGTLEYETCIIQDFSWIRIFQIDSRIVLIKAYDM